MDTIDFQFNYQLNSDVKLKMNTLGIKQLKKYHVILDGSL